MEASEMCRRRSGDPSVGEGVKGADEGVDDRWPKPMAEKELVERKRVGTGTRAEEPLQRIARVDQLAMSGVR